MIEPLKNKTWYIDTYRNYKKKNKPNAEVYHKIAILSAVEWLKEKIMKKCSTFNEQDDMVCDEEMYCMWCKDNFKLIDLAFADVINKEVID